MLEALLYLPAQSSGFTVTRPTVVMASNSMAGSMGAYAFKSNVYMTAGFGGDTKFWRLNKNQRATFEDALQIRPAPISAQISPDGKTIFLVGEKAIEAWDRKLIRRNWSVPVEGSSGPPYCHPFLPYVMVWSGPTAIRIGTEDGQAKRLPITMPFDPIPGTSRVVSAEGICDLETTKLIRPWRKGLRLLEPVAVSLDGKFAVIGNEDPNWHRPNYAATEAAYSRVQQLKVFRIADGRLLSTVPGFAAGSGWYGLITFAKAGQFWAPRLGWKRDLRTGKIIVRLPYTEATGYQTDSVTLFSSVASTKFQLPPYPVSVQDLLIQPDGRVTVVRGQKPLYRSPMSVFGGPPVLTEIDPDGKASHRPLRAQIGNLTDLPEGPGFLASSAFEVADGIKTIESRQSLADAARGAAAEWSATVYRASEIRKPSTFDKGYIGSPVVLGRSTVEVDFVSCFALHSVPVGELTVWNRQGPGLRFKWRPKDKAEKVGILAIANSPERVAICLESEKDRSNEIVILSAKDGRELRRLPFPTAVTGLLWSPDGNTLLVFGWKLGRAYRMDALDIPVDLTVGENSSGDLNDFSVSWLSGDRIAYVNSLSAVDVISLKTGLIESSAVFFADGNWRAWNAQGESDGTARPDCGPIKVWDGQRWQAAKSRSFWLKSLLTPASPRQTLRHQGPTAPARLGF
jgi:hypothetical protein